jgi:DNA-binding transcriptional regulator LsrR (DeoR family)
VTDHPGTGLAMSRFSPQLMYAAASLYYLQDATQAEIAKRLGTSRATVSRLLSEARRHGIVRIEVVPPVQAEDDLADRVARALGLRALHLAPAAVKGGVGAALARVLSSALSTVGLRAGDVLLVSSGRTVYEAAQADLPRLPGVVVVPTVGGQDEPQAWYQTNEIVRQVAAKVGGTPAFLYAPALPGPELYERLIEDASIRRVLDLWGQARCAILGIGAPPPLRHSLPSFVPAGAVRTAAGDVCTRFYDRQGRPVLYPGIERLMATSLDALRRVPVTIGVAVGAEKVPGIVAGARARYINELVTDSATAAALLAATTGHSPDLATGPNRRRSSHVSD